MKGQSLKQLQNALKRKTEKVKKLTKELNTETATVKKLTKAVTDGKKKEAAAKSKAKPKASTKKK